MTEIEKKMKGITDDEIKIDSKKETEKKSIETAFLDLPFGKNLLASSKKNKKKRNDSPTKDKTSSDDDDDPFEKMPFAADSAKKIKKHYGPYKPKSICVNDKFALNKYAAPCPGYKLYTTIYVPAYYPEGFSPTSPIYSTTPTTMPPRVACIVEANPYNTLGM